MARRSLSQVAALNLTNFSTPAAEYFNRGVLELHRSSGLAGLGRFEKLGQAEKKNQEDRCA